MRTSEPLDALVVGAGFSGVAMAVGLRERGVQRFAVLEAADELGGTWRENRYPGCACDIPAQLYSYSWAPNPGWSRTYAPQEEIWAYLRDVAARHGVLPHVRFGTRLTGARWDDAAAVWLVAVEGPHGPDELVARLLVMATGPLREPALPEVPGLATFTGRLLHSARWDPSTDVRGHRVAVVGTGASAVQIVPRLAGQARRLSVVQRTPAWVVPRLDRPVPAARQALYRQVPAAQRLARARVYWTLEARVGGFVGEPRLLRVAERISRWHLERQVADPDLRRALTPRYAIGCKRILVSDDFYPALTRPDVELVDGALAAVDGRRLLLADGSTREVDTLVLATGFHVTGALHRLPLTGRGGRTLADTWSGGAAAHLGTSVPGFPNMFLLLGPNSGLGHSSMVFMAEAQVHHALRAAAPVLDGRAAAVEVTGRAYRDWESDVQRRMRGTVWSTGCRSWYLDDHGRNPVLWPASTVRFWARSRRLRPGTYAVRQRRRAAAAH